MRQFFFKFVLRDVLSTKLIVQFGTLKKLEFQSNFNILHTSVTGEKVKAKVKTKLQKIFYMYQNMKYEKLSFKIQRMTSDFQ